MGPAFLMFSVLVLIFFVCFFFTFLRILAVHSGERICVNTVLILSAQLRESAEVQQEKGNHNVGFESLHGRQQLFANSDVIQQYRKLVMEQQIHS